MAIGSRALPDSMVDGTYAVRAVMGRLFNRLVTTGTGLGLQDTQCGFKAFRTPAARLLFHLVRIDRFAFDVELLARARRLGLRITEVPGPVEERARQHRPSPPRLGHHADRRLPVPLGLLATPPVPAVIVRGRRPSGGRRARSRRWPTRDRAPVGGRATLDGAPVPVVTGGPSVTVLLPLVEPAEVAMVFSAPCGPSSPPWRSRAGAMTLDALAGAGPPGRTADGRRPDPAGLG